MVGGVIGVLICVWFYQTAIKLNLNPLQWIVGALIVYYGAKAGWTYGILKPLMGSGFKTHTMMTGVMIEVSGSLIGAACAAFFRSKAMLKQQAN
jgi:predicted membrane protein